MDVEERALQEAAKSLFARLGSLDDLQPDLRNTVANVYYRFHFMTANMRAPMGTIANINNVPKQLKRMGTTLGEFEFIDELISQVREKRGEVGPYIFFTNLTLDVFKYRIPDAHKKSALRRAIERLFSRVDEIGGLYDRMRRLPQT